MESSDNKFKCGGLKKLVKAYGELNNRQVAKKRQIEVQLYTYLRRKVDYDNVAYNHIYLFMFHKVKGAEDIYNKAIARFEKKRQDEIAYEANLKEIVDELKKGDILVDEEDCVEWVVLEAKNGQATIKKRRGKMMMDIEGGKGEWEEVLEENDNGELPDREPILFTQMFIKV